jgi:chromosome segregation ATPase
MVNIPEQVEASIGRTQQEIETVLPDFIVRKDAIQASALRPKLQPFVNAVGLLQSKIEDKEISIDDSTSRIENERLKAEILKLQVAKDKAESDLNSIEARFLEVHEHRPLFERSLKEAQRRLLRGFTTQRIGKRVD